MAKRNWTPDQENAINARDGSILVSAAAGSGKTAVLVERVIERICDEKNPCSIDSLLIVTFTKAAAAEMKDRINTALSERIAQSPNNNYLVRQQMLLQSAQIGTIDKFCNTLVKNNFHKLEISPDYRTLSENERKSFQTEAINKAIEHMYSQNSEAFKELAEMFISDKSDNNLFESIVKLQNYSQAYAQPEKWLNDILNEYDENVPVSKSVWGKTILDYSKEILNYNISCLEYAMEELNEYEDYKQVCSAAFTSDIFTNKSILEAVESENYNKIIELFGSLSFERAARTPVEYKDTYIKEKITAIRNTCKKELKNLATVVSITEDEYKDDMKYLRPIIEKLVETTNLSSKYYSEIKNEENAYDFSDISHMALNLLLDENMKKTDLAKELSDSYSEILIDEYQDTNKAQDMMFSAISKDESNIFFVGDVKQSIYGFRLAMPEIFLKRREKLPFYAKGNYPAKINLDKNFRSRKGVTDCVNYIFSQVMTKSTGDVDYKKTESLNPAADYPKKDETECELHILNTEKMETSNSTSEAIYIANMVDEIVKSKRTIKGKDGEREIKYSDICILLRAMSHSDEYQSELKKKDIPAFCQKSGNFFSSREISTILSMLTAIDNPLLDIPLVAIMMSPIYGFSADEIAKIRIESKTGAFYNAVLKSESQKCKSFIKSLNEYQSLSTALSVENLLRTIYEKTAYTGIVKVMADGKTRYLNLLLLLQYAKDYEDFSSGGLSGFLRYIERMQLKNDKVESATGLSEYADVVQIMTIHKSKGLEFPIVILAGIGSKFNKTDQYKQLLVNPKTKIGLKHSEYGGIKLYDTVPYVASKLEIKKVDMAESLRVLYVAMTRAKERLIIVGSNKTANSIIKKAGNNTINEKMGIDIAISNAVTPLEIILTALIRHKDAQIFRDIAEINNDRILKSDFKLKCEYVDVIEESSSEQEEKEIKKPTQEMLKIIDERVTYEYPYKSLSSIVTKKSASEFNNSEDEIEFFATAKPSFLSEKGLTPSQRGTINHRFLEICDFDNAKNDLKAEIERLKSENMLTDEEEKVLKTESIKAFFESNLYKRMKNSEQIFREQKFTITIPLSEIKSEFKSGYEEESILIQGVIDCAFIENGKVVVVDYKTDRVKTKDELIGRYKNQLQIYKRAASEIFCKEVSEMLLYSFSLESEVEIN
ncbi:MAG: helicase-exonuclease AddAB subunit AddA [Oscillospiraceae bacterium]